MKPWKALGSNGFHAGFFQSQWHLIGMSMVEEVTRILNGGFITNTLGSILISLILKVPNPIHVVDFKPIALCNVVYNVFIKILANQIKDILTSIIRENQTTFVPGRNISHNIIMAQEVMHSMRFKKDNKSFMVLKGELEKAYDRVRWDFFRDTMKEVISPSHFINVILNCVTSSRM